MSVLYPFSSAVPATLNLSDPNLAVTIFASSSNMLVQGATSGLRIVILYPLTGYIGRSSPIVFARLLLSTPAHIITGIPKSMFLISLCTCLTLYLVSNINNRLVQNLCISPEKSVSLKNPHNCFGGGTKAGSSSKHSLGDTSQRARPAFL